MAECGDAGAGPVLHYGAVQRSRRGLYCTVYTVRLYSCTAAVPLGPAAAAGAVLEPGVSTRPATLGTTATPHTSTVISGGGVVTYIHPVEEGRGRPCSIIARMLLSDTEYPELTTSDCGVGSECWEVCSNAGLGWD